MGPRAGPTALDTTVHFRNPQNGCKVMQQSTCTGEELHGRNTWWLLSEWECSKPSNLPTPGHSHSSEVEQGVASAPTKEQTLPWRGAVTTVEQRGGPPQYPVQALVTTASITPPLKGKIGSIYREKRWESKCKCFLECVCASMTTSPEQVDTGRS